MTRGRAFVVAAVAAAAVVVWMPAPAAQENTAAIARDLHSTDAQRRLRVVEYLGKAGNPASAIDVAPLIGDPEDLVQLAAIDAELTFYLVEPIGDKKAVLGGARSRAQQAFDAGPLARAATPTLAMAVNQLIGAMRDGNPRVRFDAIHALGVIAEPPLSPEQQLGIADGLKSKDAVMRAATARVLGRLNAREAGEALIDALNDDDALVQRFATEALGRIREERAVASLLQRADYYGRGQMAAETWLALARIGHASTRDPLRPHLSDADPTIRRAAVEGLARMQDRDSWQAITALLTDRDASVRCAVAFAMAIQGDLSHVPDLAVDVQVRDTAAQAAEYLLEIGRPAASTITAALTTPGATDRANLLHVLGRIGGEDALPAIQALQHDPDPRVARAAADAAIRAAR